MENAIQPGNAGHGDGLHFTGSDISDINKKPMRESDARVSEFEQKVTLSMSNDSTSAKSGKVQVISDDEKLINALRAKLAGAPGPVSVPRTDAFKAGGTHEVWGAVARALGRDCPAENVRGTIAAALAKYPANVAADAWAQLEPPETDELDATRPPETDRARGLVLLPYFTGKVRYVPEFKQAGWLYWNGKVWERNAGACEQLAKQTLPREIAKRWGNYDAAADAENLKNIRTAMQWIATHPKIAARVDELDSCPWLFNLQNGTLDLRTFELLPHDPGNMITKISGTVYDPAADCPLFRETLERFVTNEDVRRFLLGHFGSCLTGIVSHLKLPILHGHGRNGKSTICGAILHTLGTDYSATMDANVLTDDGSKIGTSDRAYQLARLHGKRFIVINELEENCVLRGPQLKLIISSDPIPARRIYESPFDFLPSHKAVLLTNHKPRLRSVEDGTMRRLAIVPFDVRIELTEDDPHFIDKLRDEAAGILNLLIDGCKDWQNLGKSVPIPATVQAATDAYKNDEDVIGQFLAACTTKARGGFVTGKVLYETFKAWCEENSIESMSGTMFGRRVGTVLNKEQSAIAKYRNIIIKPNWQEDFKDLLQ